MKNKEPENKVEKQKNQYNINEEIRAKKVRVIDPNGKMLGILNIKKALEKSEHFQMDLVEVAPQAKPPVCRITDYGKLRYELTKKKKNQKKNQHKIVTKHVRLKPNIGDHDLLRKIAEIQKFLDKGCNVTVQVLLKGRQKGFVDLAEVNTIEKIKEHLENARLKNTNKQPNRITADFYPEPKKEKEDSD